MKHNIKYDMSDVLKPIKRERRTDAIAKLRKGFEYIACAGAYIGFSCLGAYTIFGLIDF